MRHLRNSLQSKSNDSFSSYGGINKRTYTTTHIALILPGSRVKKKAQAARRPGWYYNYKTI